MPARRCPRATLAGSAMLNTHISAAVAALVWMSVEWASRGKPSVLGILSGAVAGLGTITPAAGYVEPWAAMVIGFAAGLHLLLGVGRGEDQARLRRSARRLRRARRRRHFGHDPGRRVRHQADQRRQQGPAGRPGRRQCQPGPDPALWRRRRHDLRGIATWIILKIVDAMVGLRATRTRRPKASTPPCTANGSSRRVLP